MLGRPVSAWLTTGLAILLTGCLTGCAGLPVDPSPSSSSPEASSAPAPLTWYKGRTGPAWVRCYRDFSPGDDAPADLQRLTAACGPPTGLTAVTPVHVGEPQSEDGVAERLQFRARGGSCYRFFSVGTSDVGDLDVAVRDPDGQVLAADVSGDRFPVVPPRGPLCVEEEGVYTVEVAVTRGSGRFVLQVWADTVEPEP